MIRERVRDSNFILLTSENNNVLTGYERYSGSPLLYIIIYYKYVRINQSYKNIKDTIFLTYTVCKNKKIWGS